MLASASAITPANAAHALLERRRMRERLAPLVRRVFHTVDPGAVYKHNWHIDLMCEYLEAAEQRQIRRLIFNIAPRFLKSIVCSVAFPAWLLGRNPSEQILCGSYSAPLALKHSVDTRLVVESSWYRQTFPDVRLAPDQNEKRKFVTTARGHRIAVSVGGTVMGEGGNIIIIDDPHNPKKALSESERTFANEVWHDQTMSTRFNDPNSSVEIIVMQRLHDRDLTGHVLGKPGSDWEHVMIPQEPEHKTIIVFPGTGNKIVREKSALIHPARFDTQANEQAKVELGPYGYAALHQQSPVPLGGGRIKLEWFRRYMAHPEKYDEVIQSWDTASKPREINNPSVCLTFGRNGTHWNLVDVWKERVAYPILKSSALALAQQWSPDAILIEDKSSGQALIQDMPGGLPVVAIEPEADKITRMDTQVASISAGIVALPDPEHIHCPWLSGYERNMAHFPQPAEWDEIDATSQFLKYLRRRQGQVAAIPYSVPKASSWRRKSL